MDITGSGSCPMATLAIRGVQSCHNCCRGAGRLQMFQVFVALMNGVRRPGLFMSCSVHDDEDTMMWVLNHVAQRLVTSTEKMCAPKFGLKALFLSLTYDLTSCDTV